MSSGTTRATYRRWDQIRRTLCRPCRRRLPRKRLIIPHPAHQHFTPTIKRPMSQNLINLTTRIMSSSDRTKLDDHAHRVVSQYELVQPPHCQLLPESDSEQVRQKSPVSMSDEVCNLDVIPNVCGTLDGNPCANSNGLTPVAEET